MGSGLRAPEVEEDWEQLLGELQCWSHGGQRALLCSGGQAMRLHGSIARGERQAGGS